MPGAPSDLAIRQNGPVTVVEFLDRRLIDAAHIEELGQHLRQRVTSDPAPRLLLDFSKVEYLSSTALNIIIELDNAIKKKNGRLALSGLDADLMKVFTLMKLHKVLKIYGSADEAIAALRA